MNTALQTFRQHWPEYLMEAWGLGAFMVSAGAFTVLVLYSGSPVYGLISDPLAQRAVIGVAMGLTMIGIAYSPWGKQSGAHINPAFSLTFLRLGKIRFWDFVFYAAFQFLGGILGVVLVQMVLGAAFTTPPVEYVVTVPGPAGVGAALAGEIFIAALTMLTVLVVNNHPATARFTPCFIGFLIFWYVTLESPFSGFSMNPARTVASAAPSGIWTAWPLYFIAPVIGFGLGAEIYLRVFGKAQGLLRQAASPERQTLHPLRRQHGRRCRGACRATRAGATPRQSPRPRRSRPRDARQRRRPQPQDVAPRARSSQPEATSSCADLIRASRWFRPALCARRGVDGRDKPGHGGKKAEQAMAWLGR